MTRVRVATPDDAPDILDLHVASIRELGPAAYDEVQVAAWAQKDQGAEGYPVEDDGHHLVVAERDDRIVGYGHLIPGEQEVRAVYVHPEYARQGVGSTVLAHLEGYALGAGLDHLELWASLNAVAFYERMGYRPTREETIERSYDGRVVPFPIVLMEKAVSTRGG